MLAITKASLQAVFRSPSAVIFSLAFPLIFILVFGFLGSNGNISFRIAVADGCDTVNPVYSALRTISAVKLVKEQGKQLAEDVEKGRVLAVLKIYRTGNDSAGTAYGIHLKTSNAANQQNLQLFNNAILKSILNNLNEAHNPQVQRYAHIDPVEVVPGRIYRTIDFILPGQLGFSLLSSGVFGVAFLFFNLRQQLVLKRFFATPVTRTYIVLGEALARVIFQMLTAIVIILVGVFAFHFTLVNGWITFLNIMVLSFIALVVFMGFGFIVSGIARNESTIPPFANMITLPQFLLAGTFFPIDNFPKWLQPVSNIMPLSHFNTAMRNIAFEGASLASCYKEIGILALWGVVAYAAAVKVFKWE